MEETDSYFLSVSVLSVMSISITDLYTKIHRKRFYHVVFFDALHYSHLSLPDLSQKVSTSLPSGKSKDRVLVIAVEDYVFVS